MAKNINILCYIVREVTPFYIVRERERDRERARARARASERERETEATHGFPIVTTLATHGFPIVTKINKNLFSHLYTYKIFFHFFSM
jgi:hypothetical protein